MKLNDITVDKLEKIKLVATDVDGTLTDGTVYISESGEISKRFSFRDIMGVARLIRSGYIVALVSGENSKIVDIYASRLKIQEVHLGIKKKKECLESLTHKYKLERENICFIGDDINDLPALEYVGIPVVVNNASKSVKKLDFVYVSEFDGGKGAFREITDLLLADEADMWR